MKIERLPEQPNQKITVTDKDASTWKNIFEILAAAFKAVKEALSSKEEIKRKTRQ
jgi:hypothetical protein